MTAIKLQNEELQAIVVPLGAELKNLLLLKNGREIMWNADPGIWGRTSPVLFPVVGKSHNNQNLVDDKAYPMLQHGFARDLEFRLHHAEATRCSWILDASPLTLPHYPYNFSFEISYSLDGNTLTCAYTVRNTDAQPIWFSLGAHPAFILPKEGYEYYRLQFEHAETASRHLISGGLQTGETAPVLNNERELQLTQQSFAGDAVIFKDLRSTWVDLRGEGIQLRVQWENFPYLGIWGKHEPQRFICIEPWQGITENEGSSGELKDREGIMKLDTGQAFRASWSVTAEL